MVFSSLPFLFGYLVVTLAVYFAVPVKWRNLVLLMTSLFFYGWGEPVYVVIMIVSILIDYTHGMLVEKYRHNDRLAKWFVAESMIFNLALLGFFKYWDFFADNLFLLTGLSLPEQMTLLGRTVSLRNIPLPIGISFFTFQTMSYTVDVYRKDAHVQRNIISFGAYVTMFPQLIAGPIVKFKTVAEELNDRVHSTENFALGARRFTVGLAKKVLLANAIGALWDAQLSALGSGTLTVLGGWLGLVAYAFQIYFDFSGYSDMAIGLGWILGFHFDENFNYPYTADSVNDFWRRWHMSMTSWFREYLYFSLGGSRVGTVKTLRNLLIVWICTGFWHGASWNFLLWGLYYAFWQIFEKYFLLKHLRKLPAWLRHVYTLLVVLVGWGIFAIEDLGACGAYLATCFGGGALWSAGDLYYLGSYAVTLLVLAVASTTLGVRTWKKLPEKVQQIATPVLMLMALVLCTAYLVDGSYNPFLYFRF